MEIPNNFFQQLYTIQFYNKKKQSKHIETSNFKDIPT